MLRQLFVVAIVGCALAFPDANESSNMKEPLITTSLGQMKGTIITSRLGRSIFSFRGIKYAKPPINELRFKPPVPVEKWEGVFDATKDGPLCPQPIPDPISEDCLVLNVYTTKLPTGARNPKRPVVVHIHAGAFYSVGSASYWAGPNYFMDQDIVLVTFNYRLGTLGFLATGDKEAPGNNGLKDQVECLKWIKNNIAAFGGDPNSVTLLGYSAGAWSAILHMVSPMSEGLFHKVVAMSGSPVGIWPIPTQQMNLAKKQARFVGCPDDSAANIIKCLKTKPANDLGRSLLKFAEFGRDLLLIWSPVVEPDFGQPRFLTDNPIKLITSGKFKKVPVMIGQTTDEFGYMALNVVNNDTLTKEMNADWERVAPITFVYERDTEHSKIVSRAIKSFYLHNQPVDKTKLTNLAQIYADATVGFAVHRAAKLMAEHSDQPVYYYKFSYQGRYSHFYLPGTNNTVPYGVVHHDDLIYLFYVSSLFPLFKKNSPKEVEMVEKLTKIYANFAKTGNPIPTRDECLDNVRWEPFTLKDQKYMDIGHELVMHEKLFERRFAEWERLYPLSMYQKDHPRI